MLDDWIEYINFVNVLWNLEFEAFMWMLSIIKDLYIEFPKIDGKWNKSVAEYIFILPVLLAFWWTVIQQNIQLLSIV